MIFCNPADRSQRYFVVGVLLISFAVSSWAISRYQGAYNTTTIFEWLEAAALFAAFVAYALAFVWFSRAKAGIDIKFFLLASLLCGVILLLSFPAAGSDFYFYIFSDRAWVLHGQNPYLTSPAGIPTDVIAQLSDWPLLTNQHGPLRLFITAPLALFFNGSVVATVIGYQVFYTGLFLLLVLLVYYTARRIDVSNSGYLGALVALNPLILYELYRNGGGPDVLMMVFVFGGLLLAAHRRWVGMFVALAAAVATKYIPVLLLPFFFIYAVQGDGRRRWLLPAVGLGVGAALVGISFSPFWVGPETLDSLRFVGSYFGTNSAPGLAALLIFSVDSRFVLATVMPVLTLAYVFGYAGLMGWFTRLKHKTPEALIVSCSLVLLAYFLLAKFWFYPKHLIWLIPLLLLSGQRARLVALFLTGFVVASPLHLDLIILSVIPPTVVFSVAWLVHQYARGYAKAIGL